MRTSGRVRSAFPGPWGGVSPDSRPVPHGNDKSGDAISFDSEGSSWRETRRSAADGRRSDPTNSAADSWWRRREQGRHPSRHSSHAHRPFHALPRRRIKMARVTGLALVVAAAVLLAAAGARAQTIYGNNGCPCLTPCAVGPALPTNRTWCESQAGCGYPSRRSNSSTGYIDLCDSPRPPSANGTSAGLCPENSRRVEAGNGRVVINGVQPAFETGCLCCDGRQLIGVYTAQTCASVCGTGGGWLILEMSDVEFVRSGAQPTDVPETPIPVPTDFPTDGPTSTIPVTSAAPTTPAPTSTGPTTAAPTTTKPGSAGRLAGGFGAAAAVAGLVAAIL
ncbi:hypothetical protein DFJ74DRAFT_667896 [Hyaloraphidium curvatum]|nr:hypothetical protein DFJ74DRAFT_667896 [Hyaloraphidium curvatum]